MNQYAGFGDIATGPTERVPISSLLAADSPRASGEDLQHVRMLAETDAVLPPILVHRQTMRVIDGMHRLRAATLRGEHEIAVRYFDGSSQLAFVHAVRANVTHGLALSRSDREAAAWRIIASHPEWSNRMVASSTGLSDKTIAVIRGQCDLSSVRPAVRIGKDGRSRPVNSADGRRRAAEIIAARPDASLREIAGAAGIALGTARDVRERLRRGEDPVAARQAGVRPEQPNAATAAARLSDQFSTLKILERDPVLRFTESGRDALRWLGARVIGAKDWQALADTLPPHCAVVVAELARQCAEAWGELAEELERRAQLSA